MGGSIFDFYWERFTSILLQVEVLTKFSRQRSFTSYDQNMNFDILIYMKRKFIQIYIGLLSHCWYDCQYVSCFMLICFSFPMDTSSSIHYRLDIKIRSWNFVNITSIMRCEFTWKEWNRFVVDNATSIPLSKFMKYRWILRGFFHVGLMSNGLNL